MAEEVRGVTVKDRQISGELMRRIDLMRTSWLRMHRRIVDLMWTNEYFLARFNRTGSRNRRFR